MESNIRRLRKQRQITQQMLGDAMGLSQQIVSRMERDRSKIQIDMLISLADYFHVSTDEILGYQPSRPEYGRSGSETLQIRSRETGDTDLLVTIERLEQLGPGERAGLWRRLAALKPYL